MSVVVHRGATLRHPVRGVCRGRGRAARWPRARPAGCRAGRAPARSPLATLGTRIERRLSRDISGSPGSHSKVSACRCPRASGSAITGRGWPGAASGDLDQLRQRVDLGTAAFDGFAVSAAIVEAAHHGVGDVLDPDRLEARIGRRQRNTGKIACRRANRVRKRSPATEHHRRPQHREVERLRSAARPRRRP